MDRKTRKGSLLGMSRGQCMMGGCRNNGERMEEGYMILRKKMFFRGGGDLNGFRLTPSLNRQTRDRKVTGLLPGTNRKLKTQRGCEISSVVTFSSTV